MKSGIWNLKLLLLLCVLCAFAVNSCGSVTIDQVRDAAKQALKETKGKVKVESVDPESGKKVVATGEMTFDNDSTPPPAGADAKPKSCIEQLWDMFGLAFILSMLLTWVGVKYLKLIPYLAIIPSFWLSILINLGILGVWLFCIYKGWSGRHWLDVSAMNVTAWGAQALIYDKFKIKQALGKK